MLIFHKYVPYLDGNAEAADITRDEFMKFSDAFWYIPPESRRNGHPAPFPEELIYRLIKYYTFRGNTVLDMFGGTGTVAVVSKKTARNFIHIDLSEEYCSVAKRRLKKVELELRTKQIELPSFDEHLSAVRRVSEVADVEYVVQPQAFALES